MIFADEHMNEYGLMDITIVEEDKMNRLAIQDYLTFNSKVRPTFYQIRHGFRFWCKPEDYNAIMDGLYKIQPA